MGDLVKELRTKGAMLLSDPPKPDDRLRAADEIERLRSALKPFAFLDEDNPKSTTQDAWEIMYRDRFKDWVDFGNIEQARIALGKGA
jgi:hypothetical protein